MDFKFITMKNKNSFAHVLRSVFTLGLLGLIVPWLGGQSLTCPGNITQVNDPGSCSAVVTYADPIASNACATSSLSLGDIAFTGYIDDGLNQYSFVLLVDIPAGTSIHFTDRGWKAEGGFRDISEDIVTWTTSSALSAGTEVMIDDLVASVGTMSGNPLQLSSEGDQIFAYKGSIPVAGDESNFLAAIQMNGAWDNGASENRSTKPSVFTDGVNSISIFPEKDNAVYECTLTMGTPAQLRAAINNQLNWEATNNIGNLNELPSCGFTVYCSATVDLVQGLPSGSDFPVGTTTVKYRATFGDGSTAECSFTVTVKKVGDPDLLFGYTVIGFKGVKMKDNVVQSGGVGVVNSGKEVKLEKGTQITAENTFVKSPKLKKKDGSQVDTYIRGRVDRNLLPAFQSGNSCNYDVDISDNSSDVTLTRSCYGKIEVGKNVRITFSGHARVKIEEIDLKEGSSVFFNQDTELLIKKEFKGGKEMYLSNEGHEVWIFAKKDVKIDETSIIKANIYTKKKLEVKKGKSKPTIMTGLFIAEDKVESKENVLWNWDATACSGSSNQALVANQQDIKEILPVMDHQVEEVAPLSLPGQDDLTSKEEQLRIFPNPFRHETSVRFYLPEPSAVTMEVYNMQGELVHRLVDTQLEKGYHQRFWDGTAINGQQLSSGMYLISLKVGDERRISRVSLVK